MAGQGWASTGWDEPNDNQQRSSPKKENSGGHWSHVQAPRVIQEGTDMFRNMLQGEDSGAATIGSASSPLAQREKENKPLVPAQHSPWDAFPQPARQEATPRRARAPSPPPRVRDQDGSLSDKSMPSVVLDNVDVSERQRTGHVDIRGHIAPQHIFNVYGGKWVKVAWGDEENDDYDELFASDTFLTPFVVSWAENVPCNVRVDFGDPAARPHWSRDIDTNTGNFIDPLPHPDTMIGDETLSKNEAWRRLNWTASLGMRMEAKKKRKSSTPYLTVEDIGMVPLDDTKCRTKPKPYTTKIPCCLQPATAEDLAGALEIYNREITEGSQAWDVDLLKIEDFTRILDICKEGQLPFIVAIAKPDPTAATSPKTANKVIAFGFLSTYDLGLARSMYGTARYSVKANVYVHPEYRRKRIGSAILDRLLWYSASTYDHQEHYEYRGPTDDPVYMPGTSPRSRLYHNVYIELLFKGANDPQRAWYEKTMYEFGFRKAGESLENAHRTIDAVNDQGHALDKVVYHFECAGERGVAKSRHPLRRPGMNVPSWV